MAAAARPRLLPDIHVVDRLAPAAVVCVLLAHTAVFRPYITDDAFIAFRYVRNLARGHGLTYNVDERVWGYTSFVWCAVLAPFAWLGFDLAQAARVVGLVCNVLLLVVVLTDAPSPGRSRDGRWAALLLAANGAFVMQGVSGLETTLFSLLVVLSLREYGVALERGDPRRLGRAGALACLAAMTRPEGALLLLVELAHVVVRGNVAFGAAGRAALVWYAGASVPALAVFLWGMHRYYGEWWPNTITAKVGLSSEQLMRGAHYAATFLLAYPVHLLVLVVASVGVATADTRDRLLLAGAWGLLLFYGVAGGDWMLGYRLYHPVLVASAMLLPLSLRLLAGVIPRRGSAGLVTAAFVVVCAVNAAPSWLDRRVRDATRHTYVHRGIEIGKWMRANLPSDAVLATNTAGTVAYYSDLPIVDMLGLTDRMIAARIDVPPPGKASKKAMAPTFSPADLRTSSSGRRAARMSRSSSATSRCS